MIVMITSWRRSRRRRKIKEQNKKKRRQQLRQAADTTRFIPFRRRDLFISWLFSLSLSLSLFFFLEPISTGSFACSVSAHFIGWSLSFCSSNTFPLVVCFRTQFFHLSFFSLFLANFIKDFVRMELPFSFSVWTRGNGLAPASNGFRGMVPGFFGPFFFFFVAVTEFLRWWRRLNSAPGVRLVGHWVTWPAPPPTTGALPNRLVFFCLFFFCLNLLFFYFVCHTEHAGCMVFIFLFFLFFLFLLLNGFHRFSCWCSTPSTVRFLPSLLGFPSS